MFANEGKMVAYIFTFLLLCFVQSVTGDIEESKCFSRFDYDEKMLMKILKFEDKLQKFEEFIKELKAKQEQEKAERGNIFKSEIEEFNTQTTEEVAKQRNLSEESVGFLDEAKVKLTASLVEHKQSQKEFEDKLQKFEDFIKLLKANQEQEKAERENIFKSKIDEFKKQMTEEATRQRNLREEIVGFLDEAKAKLKASLVEHKESRKEKIVAFTVTNPADGPGSTPLTFTTVVINEGDGFDTSTGVFTCPADGLYYFTLNILKRNSPWVDRAGCYINLNGISKVRAFTDPQNGATGADNGSYGVTNSVYLRLKIGDVVNLQDCVSRASSMESWSSFSGSLARDIFNP